VGRDNGGNRWQGYSHQELYDMLHSGPGSAAAGSVADRWSSMAGALSDIQQEIAAGVTASGATWDGSAADSARGAIGPLGEWAQQASTAADVMRISTELQGDLLAKARADMPAPVAVPQQPAQVAQVVTAQVDYEVAEMASQVAAQQAYQVMAQYESATGDNTSTLGDFGEPPSLVMDTTPITGPVVRTSVRAPEPVRSTVRGTGRATAGPVAEKSTGPGSRTRGSGRRTAPVRPVESAPEPEPAHGPGSGSSSGSGSGPQERIVVPDTAPAAEGPAPTTSAGTPTSPSPSPTTPSSTAPSSTVPSSTSAPAAHGGSAGVGLGESVGSTTTSSAASTGATAGASAGFTSNNPVAATSSSHDRGSSDSGSPATMPPGQQGTRFTGAMVPAARRPNQADEQDDLLHESKYLIDADDIYGHQTYSPPVIGESPRRR
jgi:hypothetical protein